MTYEQRIRLAKAIAELHKLLAESQDEINDLWEKFYANPEKPSVDDLEILADLSGREACLRTAVLGLGLI